MGNGLASLRAFAAGAKTDYTLMTPQQQLDYKLPLNSLIMAVDAADQTYVAYHNGLTNIQVAQSA